ncbi:MAG: hypothetical protein ABIO49_15705 [Dokdonella sp.]
MEKIPSIRGNALDRLALHCTALPPWMDSALAAFLSVAIAVCAYGLWPATLGTPLAINGDPIWYLYLIKTLAEHGWIVTNSEMGAPFGAQLLDFPIPEPTNFLLVLCLSLFSHSPFVIFNLFFLVSFATCAIAARWAIACFGTGRLLAMAGAILFAILPYHFLRLGHLFLASYFSVAIMGCYAMRLALYRAPHVADEPTTHPGSLLLLAVAAGGGIYYAFFGCLFIGVGAILGSLHSRYAAPLRVGCSYIAIVTLVVVLSLTPSIAFHISAGPNQHVAQRAPQDAEIYGLRITQLLLPTIGHRIQSLAAITTAYEATAPLINENKTAALGAIGSFGFLAAIVVGLLGGWSRHRVLAAAGTLVAIGLLYANIGGFGALFARFVTPDIRGLNRISVYIGFFSILSVLVLAHQLLASRRNVGLAALFAAFLVGVGWLDQIPVRTIGRIDARTFQQQQAFFDQLQLDLPRGSAVFQLPYMYFPESPSQGSLGSYDQLVPYLRTRDLHWSFGDMHGRSSDTWDEQVSSLSSKEMAVALGHAGFGAVYVDRRGYADHGAAIEKELVATLGAPFLEDVTRTLAVYRIPRPSPLTRPFIAIDAGRNWFPWESNAKDPSTWSKGDADLMIANPADYAVRTTVRFTLATLLHRHVKISYGDRLLSEYDLSPGKTTDVVVTINAAAGISNLALTTDESAAVASNGDPRHLAFQIRKLAYGASP